MKKQRVLAAIMAAVNAVTLMGFNISVSAESAETVNASAWAEYINSTFYVMRGISNFNITRPLLVNFEVGDTSTVTKVELAVTPRDDGDGKAETMSNMTLNSFKAGELPLTETTTTGIIDTSSELHTQWQSYYDSMTSVSGYTIESIAEGATGTIDITNALKDEDGKIIDCESLTVNIKSEKGASGIAEISSGVPGVQLVVTRDNQIALDAVNSAADAAAMQTAVETYGKALDVDKSAVKYMNVIYSQLAGKTYATADDFKTAFDNAVSDYKTNYIKTEIITFDNRVLHIDTTGTAPGFYVNRNQAEGGKDAGRYVLVTFPLGDIDTDDISDVVANINLSNDDRNMGIVKLGMSDLPSAYLTGNYTDTTSAGYTAWKAVFDSLSDISTVTVTDSTDVYLKEQFNSLTNKNGSHFIAVLQDVNGTNCSVDTTSNTLTVTYDIAEKEAAKAELLAKLNTTDANELKAAVEANAEALGIDSNAVLNMDLIYSVIATGNYADIDAFKNAFNTAVENYKSKYYVTKSYNENVLALIINQSGKGVYINRAGSSESLGTDRAVLMNFNVADVENIVSADLTVGMDTAARTITLTGADYTVLPEYPESSTNYTYGTDDYNAWYAKYDALTAYSITPDVDAENNTYSFDVSSIVNKTGNVVFAIEGDGKVNKYNSGSHILTVTYDDAENIAAQELVVSNLNTTDASALKAYVEANAQTIGVDTSAVKYMDEIYKAVATGGYKTINEFAEAFNAAVESYKADNYKTVEIANNYEVFWRDENATDGAAMAVNRAQSETLGEGQSVLLGFDADILEDLVSADINISFDSYTEASIVRAGLIEAPADYNDTNVVYIPARDVELGTTTTETLGYNAWVDAIKSVEENNIAVTYDSTAKTGVVDVTDIVKTGEFAVLLTGTGKVAQLGSNKLVLVYDTYETEKAFLEAVNSAQTTDAMKTALCSNSALFTYEQAYNTEIETAILQAMLDGKEYASAEAVQEAFDKAVLEYACDYEFVIDKVSVIGNDANADQNESKNNGNPFSYVGSVLFTRAKNTYTKETVKVIAAIYRDNKLESVSVDDVTLNEANSVGGQQKVGINLFGNNSPDEIKIFIWDSVETGSNMQPVAEPIIVNKPENTTTGWYLKDGSFEAVN